MCVRCGDVTHVGWKPLAVVRPESEIGREAHEAALEIARDLGMRPVVPPTPRRSPVIVRSWEVRPVAVPVVAPERWRCDYCGLEDDGPVPERCWLCESKRQAG